MTAFDIFWERCEGSIVYGVNDCCMTLADVIVAAGGHDLMASYRGRYSTRLGFVRAFRKHDHKTLADAVAAEFHRHGRHVDEPCDFDVAMISYRGPQGVITSPAFFHEGLWFARSDAGSLALMHASFNHKPDAYRVL